MVNPTKSAKIRRSLAEKTECGEWSIFGADCSAIDGAKGRAKEFDDQQ